jgi:site-specific DNA-adenine methylase
MKAPFPWFGGKRRVAPWVWSALGDVDNYIEPFAGSLAVLLERPADHRMRCETVNDADSYVANFWRALQADPEAVAHHCDWPVNETDLLARHLWLVNEGRARIAKLEADPEAFDAKVAGWWLWGIASWIGSGWCSGKGPWVAIEGEVRQRPHLGDAGQGVNRKLPHLGNAGQGVNRKLPHLGDAGRGVNRKLPHLGDAGRADAYLIALADRLRRVRVCCGDWSRVVTNGATSYGATVGVLLDPPYLGDVRTKDLYTVDDHTIAHAVRGWAISKGDDPRFRIVLAGYEDEHEALMPATWRRIAYSASKAYGTTRAVGERKGNDANRHKERLWLSPHCLGAEESESGEMFGRTA